MYKVPVNDVVAGVIVDPDANASRVVALLLHSLSDLGLSASNNQVGKNFDTVWLSSGWRPFISCEVALHFCRPYLSLD